MKNIRNGTRSCDSNGFVCSGFDNIKFGGLGNMDAPCVFHSHSVLRFPTFSPFSKQCYLRKSSQSLKEVAVGISTFVPQTGFDHFSISNKISDGDKRGQSHERKAVSGRSEKGDGIENKRPQIFDGKKLSKSSDQQEIIALLRRIQISISEGDSQQGQGSANKTSSNPEKDKPSSSESILDVLRESGKQVKEKISNGDTEKVLTKKRGVSRKKKEVTEHQQETKFTLTRLPSSFVRKSPIPSPSAPREKVLGLNDEDKQLQAERRLEKMKLTELKELAKSRNIKGYSKLKKGELIDILGSV